MNKIEFLDQLNVSLNGKLKPEQVEDNLRYYEEYINGQLRLGRTESEVMNSLGSPRLIARTIMDASKRTEKYMAAADEAEPMGRNANDHRSDYDHTDFDHMDFNDAFRFKTNVPWLMRFMVWPNWLKKTCGILALVLVSAVIILVLKFLFPFLVIMMVAIIIKKLFWDWLR